MEEKPKQLKLEEARPRCVACNYAFVHGDMERHEWPYCCVCAKKRAAEVREEMMGRRGKQ